MSRGDGNEAQSKILLPPVSNPGDNAGVAIHVGLERRERQGQQHRSGLGEFGGVADQFQQSLFNTDWIGQNCLRNRSLIVQSFLMSENRSYLG